MNGEWPQDESEELTAAIEELRAEARWLFLSRLATGWQFHFVPLEQVDAAALAPEVNIALRKWINHE